MPQLLRDHLLQSLSTHPGNRTFHLHVLESTARRTDGEPFPHAKGKPKIYVRDVFVLLSEEREREGGSEETENLKHTGRVLTTGIESSIYTFPQTKSMIVYICKVDSTGYATKPSPTHQLVLSFIRYFCDKEKVDGWIDGQGGVTNVWIQLFARSQSEYLFLGSKKWKGKKVLGDVGLCGWWKRCLGEAVKGMEVVGKWYVLPGQNREEAEDAMRNAGAENGESDGWVYGHPYSSGNAALPCPQSGGEDLARMIPCFEDDPKSRFLDELRLDKTLSKVGVDEFWERMSFRQECIAAVTGFFAVVLRLGEDTATTATTATTTEISSQAIDRVKTMLENASDFSTADRAMKATELIEGSISGFCEEGSYRDAVYGTIETANVASESRKRQREGHVTQLVARRKKKART